MNNGWIKHFKDGTTEVGFDSLVMAKRASWQRGRLDGLSSVEIRHGKFIAILTADEGEWWQSDSMEVNYSPGRTVAPRFITRRIQRRLTEKDVGSNIYIHRPSLYTATYSITSDCWAYTGQPDFTNLIVQPEQVGSWFVVSIDAVNEGLTHYFSERKK